jgi:hypothetical protein
MNESLIEIIEEQISIKFTGRINCLKKENSQLVGEIIINEGHIIYSDYLNGSGIKSLLAILIHEFDYSELKFIVEPEIININKRNIINDYSYIKKYLSKNYEEYIQYKDLKPQRGISIFINKDFIIKRNNSLTSEEFDLLCLIYEYSDVDSLYYKTKMYDFEITKNLVRLRKNGALKVSKRKNENINK